VAFAISNGPALAMNAHMPFGGVGIPGYGRFGAKQESAGVFTADLRWINH